MKDHPIEEHPIPTADSPDPLEHPWIEEMRQYEPIDEQQKEAEAWF